MEADFSGYATKAGLKCSDGRTIMPGAFKHQDQIQVPLVWMHGHKDITNVLGHAILEAREDGMYCYGFFNDSPAAVHAREAVDHRDVNQMSIWANELMERSKQVLHGAIREVSLVLSGANPGALIENVTIRHSDGDEMVLEDEAIIFSGIEFDEVNIEHAEGDEPKAEGNDDDDDDDVDDDTKVGEIYDSMTEEQKEVLHFMVGQAFKEAKEETDAGDGDDNNSDTLAQDNLTHQEGTDMTKRNVFEKDTDTDTPQAHVLSHDAMKGIVADGEKLGSLKEAVENYAIAHGIEDIDVLFPDAKTLNNTPEFLSRRMEWVSKVLGATRKSPFSRVRTISADITPEQARAKGYIKGNLKKEEFFRVSKRETTPTTIYKKQKLDRDDIVDITDFDVVAWLRAEMRIMLDEELARAVLIGDGRDISDDDKVNEQNIRPIATDHELYTTTVNVNIDDANSSFQEVVDAIVLNRSKYKGTGLPTMFTTETWIARALTLKDGVGRRLYKTLDELATELRVSEIVPVEVMEEEEDIICILVNLNDYVMGADKGGNVSMFDDFDIDYNKYKYLIETRCSGALTKLKSAIVVRKVAASNVLVVPNEPAFDGEDITITNQTGVVYKNAATDAVMNNAGSPYAVPSGETVGVQATPASGYYFASSDDDFWTFTNES